MPSPRLKRPTRAHNPREFKGGLDRQALLAMYRTMLLTREFEETVNRLYQQGKIVGGAYSGRGNEATSVGSAFALAPGDYVFPLHRDLGVHLARGQSPAAMMLQYFGRAEGMARGRDGTGHYADPKKRIFGNISHLGAMVPVAVGVALASRIRKEPSVTLTYIGDGGANVGEVHEGLAMASVMSLPFVLIIENNQYAYSTPVSKQLRTARFSDRAAGYGIPGVTIDGTDILEVYRTCREAIERARRGEGPTIIESVTLRMQGHAAHDTAWYVPRKLMDEWKKKDPIQNFEKFLIADRSISIDEKNGMLEEIRALVDKAATHALEGRFPPGEEAVEGVYAPLET